MTTIAGHSFYIGPIGSFYNQVNNTGCWEPLVFCNISHDHLKITRLIRLNCTISSKILAVVVAFEDYKIN
jgi:hypothetical protein